MECIEFLKYLDSLCAEQLDTHDRILFEQVSDRLATIKDEFANGAYSIQEKKCAASAIDSIPSDINNFDYKRCALMYHSWGAIGFAKIHRI